MNKGEVDPLEKEVDDFIKRFDGNKDSKLSAEELKWGVRHLLIPLSKDQRERLLQLVDENQDGEISREVLLPSLPFLSLSLIVSFLSEGLSDGCIVQEIANFLRYRTNQLSDLFKEFDRDDSGFIDQSEVSLPFLSFLPLFSVSVRGKRRRSFDSRRVVSTAGHRASNPWL